MGSSNVKTRLTRHLNFLEIIISEAYEKKIYNDVKKFGNFARFSSVFL